MTEKEARERAEKIVWGDNDPQLSSMVKAYKNPSEAEEEITQAILTAVKQERKRMLELFKNETIEDSIKSRHNKTCHLCYQNICNLAIDQGEKPKKEYDIGDSLEAQNKFLRDYVEPGPCETCSGIGEDESGVCPCCGGEG